MKYSFEFFISKESVVRLNPRRALVHQRPVSAAHYQRRRRHPRLVPINSSRVECVTASSPPSADTDLSEKCIGREAVLSVRSRHTLVVRDRRC